MQNEIDLLKYFSQAGALIRNNFAALILLLVLSGAAAAGLYFAIPRKYETQLVATSKYLKPEALEVAMNALNRASEEGNYQLVADYLKMDVGQVGGLESISLRDVRPAAFTPGREEKNEYEKIYYFEIRLTTRSPENYDKFQQGILAYLEGNDFVQARRQVYEETGKAQLEKINKEVERLNELREQIFTGSQSRNYTIMDPSALNQTIVDISKEARELEVELKLNRPIQVIQGFIRYDKPAFPLKKHAAMGAALLWIIFSGLYLIVKK